MHELRMKQSEGWPESVPSVNDGASLPQRELRSFINAVSELIGPEPQGLLREIWLDELACLDCMPAPSSSEWRLVTLAAFRRLAMRLIAIDRDPNHLWGT